MIVANSIKITVLFEEPFWAGILEKSDQKGYAVAKIIFGAEPTNNDVQRFLLTHFDELQFGRPIVTTEKVVRKVNPKRKQREAQKELQDGQLVSRAHDAIKRMQEEVKIERKFISKERREMLKEKKYQLKLEKKKQKHRGH